MDRRAFLVCGACAALTQRLMRAQSLVATSDTAEAVIAALLTRLHGQQPSGPGPLLLQRTPFATEEMVVSTATFTPMQRASHQTPALYIHPPQDRMGDAQDVADGYNRALKTPASPLSDSLRLSFPHVLLNDEEVRQFYRLHPQGNVYSAELAADAKRVPNHYKQLFGGATQICSVSRVGLNAAKTLAVVGVRQQGGSCGSEGWTVLSKSEGDTWEPLHWQSTGVAVCA